MPDNKKDNDHCNDCDKSCSECQDTYLGEFVWKSKGLFMPLEKTSDRYLHRYAQDRTMEKLLGIVKVA